MSDKETEKRIHAWIQGGLRAAYRKYWQEVEEEILYGDGSVPNVEKWHNKALTVKDLISPIKAIGYTK